PLPLPPGQNSTKVHGCWLLFGSGFVGTVGLGGCESPIVSSPTFFAGGNLVFGMPPGAAALNPCQIFPCPVDPNIGWPLMVTGTLSPWVAPIHTAVASPKNLGFFVRSGARYPIIQAFESPSVSLPSTTACQVPVLAAANRPPANWSPLPVPWSSTFWSVAVSSSAIACE